MAESLTAWEIHERICDVADPCVDSLSLNDEGAVDVGVPPGFYVRDDHSGIWVIEENPAPGELL